MFDTLDRLLSLVNGSPTVALLLLLLLLVPPLYWYSVRNHRYWSARGVPGPTPFPVIGSFFSLRRPISALYLDYMKKYGKIYGMYEGQRPILVVAEPDAIKRILVKDFVHFQNRLPFAQEPRQSDVHTNLVDARDDAWKRMRSIVTTMFTTAKLRRMEHSMIECTETMIGRFAKKSKRNLYANSDPKSFHANKAMGKFTMDVIARCAFGTETTAQFVRNARDLLRFRLPQFLISQFIPLWLHRFLHFVKFPYYYTTGGADFFAKLAQHLLAKRKAENENSDDNQPKDLFQLMIKAQYDPDALKDIEPEDSLEAHHIHSTREDIKQEHKYFSEIIGSKFLTPAEIITNSIVFFVAGYETTASTLGYCLYELAQNPDIQQRLYCEIQRAKERDPKLCYATLQSLEYLDAILCETLRKYPPAITVINRECAAERYTIPEAQLTIERGTLILIPVYAIHHCEEFFPDPDRFDPERFLPENRDLLIRPYTYIPFGVGPRNCVGMRFALQEAKIALARLIDRFVIENCNQTPTRLRLELCSPILKTEPIPLRASIREHVNGK